MSINAIINPGFGIGAFYGTPTTIALAETSTLSITSALVGQFMVSSALGVNVTALSTSNGVTGTYTILTGCGVTVLDGTSCRLVNTTTSVGVCFIKM